MVPFPIDPRFQDLTGKTFGPNTVVCYLGQGPSGSMWKVKCDRCGKVRILGAANVKKSSISKHGCGCRRSIHAAYGTDEYTIWIGMKARCRNANDNGFPQYGRRGIKVCKRWLDSFSNFLADMGPRPSRRHTIDRIDPNGNYEPRNCRWATWTEQARNKRNTVQLTIGNTTKSLWEWSDLSKIPGALIYQRMTKQGWVAKDAVFTPVRTTATYAIGRKKKTLKEWSEVSGIAIGNIRARLAKGFSLKEAITKPIGASTRRQMVTCGGETRCIRQWSFVSGIPAQTIYKRIAHGWNLEDAIFTQPSRDDGGKPFFGSAQFS